MIRLILYRSRLSERIIRCKNDDNSYNANINNSDKYSINNNDNDNNFNNFLTSVMIKQQQNEQTKRERKNNK